MYVISNEIENLFLHNSRNGTPIFLRVLLKKVKVKTVGKHWQLVCFSF